MIFEFLWAWFDNLTVFFFILGVVAVVASGFGIAMANEENSSEREAALGRSLMAKFIPAAIVCIVLATIPGPESMWKVRVGLMKLELASPENVKAVGGHVEEIVKALECKHLGVNCPKEAK